MVELTSALMFLNLYFWFTMSQVGLKILFKAKVGTSMRRLNAPQDTVSLCPKVKVKVAKVGFAIVKLGLVVFKNGSDLGYKGHREVEFGQ